MQIVMYPAALVENEIISSNNIKLRTCLLEEFDYLVSNGNKIYCIETLGTIDALGRTQGFIQSLTTENRNQTRISLVEYTGSKIPEAAIVCLLDILTNLCFYRFQILNKDFFYEARKVKIIKEKISHLTYPTEYDDILKRLIFQGFELLENSSFVLSLLRLSNAFTRTDFRDLVLDCSSSIESLFNFSKELKLKYFLAAYHIDIYEPRYSSKMVKKLYEVRSNIIHGRKADEIKDNQFVGDLLTLNKCLLLSIIFRNELLNDEQLTEEILNHYKGLEEI